MCLCVCVVRVCVLVCVYQPTITRSYDAQVLARDSTIVLDLAT